MQLFSLYYWGGGGEMTRVNKPFHVECSNLHSMFQQWGGGLICREPTDHCGAKGVPKGLRESHDQHRAAVEGLQQVWGGESLEGPSPLLSYPTCLTKDRHVSVNVSEGWWFVWLISIFDEQGINIHLAKKMIEDRSRDYMNARRVAKVRFSSCLRTQNVEELYKPLIDVSVNHVFGGKSGLMVLWCNVMYFRSMRLWWRGWTGTLPQYPRRTYLRKPSRWRCGRSTFSGRKATHYVLKIRPSSRREVTSYVHRYAHGLALMKCFYADQRVKSFYLDRGNQR